MAATLRALGDEFVGLLVRAGSLWWRLWPWLVGFGLIGWAGYYGSVLAGAQVALDWPWLVVGCLAIGVVVQLVATIAALRLALVRGGATTAEPARAGTPLRLLSITVLPFLAIFAAFGLVDSYARDVVTVVAVRAGLFGGADFLNALNPTATTAATIGVVAGVAGLFGVRKLLETLAERTGRVWLGLLAAVAEAGFGVLVLLSGFRLVEHFWLWLDEREVAAWWDGLTELVAGWVALPPPLAVAWDFLARSAWPVAWDLLSQPLAWLALAAVVAGIQTLPGGGVGRELLAGDLDAKYLPLWHALRFLTRAGWPLLGGFVLAFTALDWAGDLLVEGLIRLAGPFTGEEALLTLPFVQLLPQVVVLSLRVALLAVTIARVGQPRPAPAATARRSTQPVVVVAVCVAVALSSLALRPTSVEVVRTARLGEAVAIASMTVTVEEVRAGAPLRESGPPGAASDLSFVVVAVTLHQPAAGTPLAVELRSGDRTYLPWEGATALTSRPGFSNRRDLAFEVDPADLDGESVLRLIPSVAVSNGVEIAEVVLPPQQLAGPVSYDGTGAEWVP